MNLNEMVDQVHQEALNKGWWTDHEIDRDLSPDVRAAKHMLIVTEVAEATEQVREGKPPIWTHNEYYLSSKSPGYNPHRGVKFGDKPEGEAIELADVVIRVMDYFGFMGWDLEKAIQMKFEYNKTRPIRHGGKAL